jgi:hypothetical protein
VAAGAINMRAGPNSRPPFLSNLEDLHHEGDGLVLFERFAGGFSEDSWANGVFLSWR